MVAQRSSTAQLADITLAEGKEHGSGRDARLARDSPDDSGRYVGVLMKAQLLQRCCCNRRRYAHENERVSGMRPFDAYVLLQPQEICT